MRELFSWLPIISLVLGGLFLYGADELAMPALVFVGLLFFGAGALLSGIRAIISQEVLFIPSASHSEGGRAGSFSGLPARLWGVFFILLGFMAWMAGGIGLSSPQRAQAFVEQALDAPWGWGILSAGFGLFVALVGTTRILSGSASEPAGTLDNLREIGYRGWGFIQLLFGAGLVSVGFFLVVAPDRLSAFFLQLAEGLLGLL